MIQTRVLRADPESPSGEVLEVATVVLRQGGLVAFPTETVYGLGAHALDPKAIRRIFHAKGRPSTDPLIVHLADTSQVTEIAKDIPAAISRLEPFFPGPLTVVLPKGDAVPDEVSAGLPSVALRFPSHPVARALLRHSGLPIAAPSANRFTRPSPTLAEHVLEDLQGEIDLVLDGGPTWHGVESTIVDLTRWPPMLLRPGAITVERLREKLPELVVPGAPLVNDEKAASSSPGQFLRHYAPRSPVLLFSGPCRARALEALGRHLTSLLQQGQRVGLLIDDEAAQALEDLLQPDAPTGATLKVSLGHAEDLEEAARRLFAGLRTLDEAEVHMILALGYTPSGLGRTLQDRLYRAADGRIVDCP